jgi:hypothetical protein
MKCRQLKPLARVRAQKVTLEHVLKEKVPGFWSGHARANKARRHPHREQTRPASLLRRRNVFVFDIVTKDFSNASWQAGDR